MEKWYQSSKEKAVFYIVYIREAHPADSNWPAPDAPNDPTTMEGREQVASDCIKSMKLSIPFLIDDMKDTASKGYAAWPDRIYIISTEGKIAYKAGQGPWGFKPKDAMAKLQTLLDTKKDDPEDDYDKNAVRAAPRDAFPVLNDPKLVDADDAADIKDEEPVIGVEMNGVAKAYPISVMGIHELGNDTCGDTPIAVSW